MITRQAIARHAVVFLLGGLAALGASLGVAEPPADAVPCPVCVECPASSGASAVTPPSP